MSEYMDLKETFNSLREERRERRAKHGVKCPACLEREPKRNPTILLPGQRCFCGYRDPCPRTA